MGLLQTLYKGLRPTKTNPKKDARKRLGKVCENYTKGPKRDACEKHAKTGTRID